MRKTAAVILLLSMLMTVAFSLHVSADTATVNGLRYWLESDGTCAVDGYTGSQTEITIPEKITVSGKQYVVTAINDFAFSGHPSITKINVPDSIRFIRSFAFAECENLEYKEYNNALYLGNSGNEYAVLIKAKNSDITGCTVNGNTKVIADYAFDGCKNISSITVPDGVTYIGGCAFYECRGLENINISKSVLSIGYSAFYGCSGLKNIVVNGSNKNYTSVDGVLFNKDKTTLIQYPVNNAKTEYTVPDGVTAIEGSAFYGSKNLVKVTVADSVASIGGAAFSYCSGLKTVKLPNSISAVNDYVFYECTSLESVVIPDGVTVIDGFAFYCCISLSSITIPESVGSIGIYAFCTCTSLNTVYYPGSEAKWRKIEIDNTDNENDPLINAEKVYNYTPVTVKPGDVNGDGSVNNKDVIALFRHLSGYVVDVIGSALDVNGDGAVNNKDIAALFKAVS